jgi:hypothetical protein
LRKHVIKGRCVAKGLKVEIVELAEAVAYDLVDYVGLADAANTFDDQYAALFAPESLTDGTTLTGIPAVVRDLGPS